MLIAHEPLLVAVTHATQEVLLASPFISARAAGRLRSTARASSATWRLLTALRPSSVATGVLNLEALRWLIDAGVGVRSSTRLHAKVSLCDGTFGLVGSANLTETGLGLARPSNLELGVSLNAAQCGAARLLFENWWSDATVVDEAALREVERQARDLPRPARLTPGKRIATGSVGALAETLLLEARDRGLWVKAVYGDGGALFDGEGWIFSSPGRPSFKIGDLVLVYSREAGACNAVVEIVSEARHDPEFVEIDGGYSPEDANRWPWVNEVRGRLVIPADQAPAPEDIGFTAQGLQNGRKRLDLSQFAIAMRLASGQRPEE